MNKDRNKLVTEAKEKSVLNTLVKLASVDNEFIIENFIEYFKERKAFTPKQLSLLIWRLKKADIDFNKSHFKLTIKKKGAGKLITVRGLETKSIWECLSSSQKKFVMEKNCLELHFD